MRQIATKSDARFQSNSTLEQSNEDDVANTAENCVTESGCRNGCQTPVQPHISTISRGEFLLPSFVRRDDSSTTLTSSSSSGVTETGSGSGNCSTPPDVDDDKSDAMTSSACAVRETAIMGDSSEERLDSTGNCLRNAISGDVIFGDSLIRQPLYERNFSRQSQSSSHLLNCDFVRRLDYGPETDILFSESASDVRRNSEVVPEVETYLRLPPTLLYSHDAERLDNLPARDAASVPENDSRQRDVVDYPEVNSTTSTTTTTMSLGHRSSSAGAINRAGVDFDKLPSPSCYRRSSIVDRQRRLRTPETEIRRRVTSPLDRNAATVALSASELRRARAKALTNWAKLREQFRQRQFDVDEPRFRAAALRLLEDEVRRYRSSDRRVSRRVRRTSPSRDNRRRCISAETSTARRRSKGANPCSTVHSGNAVANNPAFHPASDRHPQLSDPEATAHHTAIPTHVSGSVDNISTTVDLATASAALPYDYEPLSFDDGGGSGPFSYMDDPFDYDDTGEHDSGKVTVPITICLIIIAGYIFAGAVLFTLWEDWDYLTGSYFCFITLSTIGFGDIVPGTDMDKWASSEKLVLCALWLAFGLSLLAMCFNLMQEEVKEKSRWIGLRLGLLRDDEPQ